MDELSAELVDAWRDLRDADPGRASPFFHPEFARAVHETLGPVTVAVAGDADRTARLFWPLQRHRRVLRPVGWPAADFQGPVGSTALDPRDLLGVLGARSLAFDHLVADAGPVASRAHTWRVSPYLDVAGGLEAYLGRASRSGRSNMGQARRHANKAAARLGELAFEPRSTSHELLDELIGLKRRQYRATGSRDFFAVPGRVGLLHRLLDTDSDDFTGVLSAVQAGDRLLAAHFGLRSRGIMHWWFPVYDPGARDLAPGWILLRELVAAAPALGVRRIDLGRGDDEYKRRAMTGQDLVGEGTLCSTWSGATRLALTRRTRGAVRASGLAPRLRQWGRRLAP